MDKCPSRFKPTFPARITCWQKPFFPRRWSYGEQYFATGMVFRQSFTQRSALKKWYPFSGDVILCFFRGCPFRHAIFSGSKWFCLWSNVKDLLIWRRFTVSQFSKFKWRSHTERKAIQEGMKPKLDLNSTSSDRKPACFSGIKAKSSQQHYSWKNSPLDDVFAKSFDWSLLSYHSQWKNKTSGSYAEHDLRCIKPRIKG